MIQRFIYNIPCIFCVTLLCCASFVPIEKIYEDNKIVKVVLRDSANKISGWFIITYDNAHRITTIQKFASGYNTPSLKAHFQYKANIISSYTLTYVPLENDKITYQSTHIFNYSQDLTLRRVDISFNKPASIKRAGTTFIKITYHYTDNILSGFTIQGDAFSFKITCNLIYDRNILHAIRIDEKRYSTTTKKFEQGAKGILYINSSPKHFVDELTNTTIKDKEYLNKLYVHTFIKDALDKLLLPKGNNYIIDYFIHLENLL